MPLEERGDGKFLREMSYEMGGRAALAGTRKVAVEERPFQGRVRVALILWL